MGKALLFIVLGASVVLAKQLWGSHEAGMRTARDQRNYQETVLAREIATSAFNVGMGDMRAYGERIRAAVTAFNGPDNAGRAGTISGGKYAGGKYHVRAQQMDGHTARIVATGYYGRYLDENGDEQWRGKVTLHDEYRVFVLTPRQTSIIDVSILPGAAGHCSAVFYQGFTPEMVEGVRPAPIMLFAPNNSNRSAEEPVRQIVVEAGTQMNFFIGVDPNCSERLPSRTTTCEGLAYALNYRIDLTKYNEEGTRIGSAPFDYIHRALNVEAGRLGQAEEAIWAFVEQHPDARNRWRIGWEDLHRMDWNQPDSRDPRNSLQATKRMGYDGLGWPETDDRGYGKTRDYGNRPDFEDQVIEITAVSVATTAGQDRVRAARQQYERCNLPVPTDIASIPLTTAPTTTAPTTTAPTTTTPTTTTPTTTTPTTTTPTTATPPLAPVATTSSCPCTTHRNKKVRVRHFNASRTNPYEDICIADDGWFNGHDRHDRDYLICRAP